MLVDDFLVVLSCCLFWVARSTESLVAFQVVVGPLRREWGDECVVKEIFADVTGGGDRHRSEPEWLEKIADELDGSASEEVEQPTSGMDAPTPADGEGVAPTDLNKVILRIKDLAGIK